MKIILNVNGRTDPGSHSKKSRPLTLPLTASPFSAPMPATETKSWRKLGWLTGEVIQNPLKTYPLSLESHRQP
ncbi:hypothetical protein [Caldibacillus debilis]|nr:hypothetical protein [Caldibacillus debilis]